MGCGCRKNRAVIARTTSSAGEYEVFRNGVSTGRKFSSLIAAQSYANKVDGTIQSA